MASIIDFDHIRAGNHWPQTLDIEPILGHLSDGIRATFFAYRDQPRVELRRKDEEYCLFLFRDANAEMPERWQDSELLWQLGQ